jgi:hypothetical protein
MKTISLWTLWAMLIARGHKKIETRSWKAPKWLIGQRIAIHATKAMPVLARILCREFAKLLGIKIYTGSWLYNLEHGVGPFGKVVATAKLAGCEKIVNSDDGCRAASLESGKEIRGNEYSFGDYTPGRYAWILEDIQPLKEPTPAKGMQGLWNWEGDRIATNY